MVATKLQCGVELTNELVVGRLCDDEDSVVWRSVEQVPNVLLNSQGLDCCLVGSMSFQNTTSDEPLVLVASSS